MYVDRLLVRAGTIGSLQFVLNVAERRLEVQPGRGAVADPDVDLAVRTFGEDGTTFDLAQAQVAVGGLHGRRAPRPVDGDPAVGGFHAHVARDLADPRVAVGVLDHRRPVDAADPHGSGRRDLGIADDLSHRDVTGTGFELERARLVELDVADAGLEAASADVTGAVQRGHPRLTVHL